MIEKWKNIYMENDVCMVHLLSSDEANELSRDEKKRLLLWAGEYENENEMDGTTI